MTFHDRKQIQAVRRLQARHEALEQQIAAEAGRLAPNDLRISNLKRRKLWIKDRLFGFSSGQAPPEADNDMDSREHQFTDRSDSFAAGGL